MAEREKPFRYLTSVQFLALPERERIAYLEKVNDHLKVRVALLKKPEKPQKKS